MQPLLRVHCCSCDSLHASKPHAPACPHHQTSAEQPPRTTGDRTLGRRARWDRRAPGMTRMLPGCASAWNSPSVSIISPYASDTRVMMRAAAALRWKALRPATRSRSRVICRRRSLSRAQCFALLTPYPRLYPIVPYTAALARLRTLACPRASPGRRAARPRPRAAARPPCRATRRARRLPRALSCGENSAGRGRGGGGRAGGPGARLLAAQEAHDQQPLGDQARHAARDLHRLPQPLPTRARPSPARPRGRADLSLT